MSITTHFCNRLKNQAILFPKNEGCDFREIPQTKRQLKLTFFAFLPPTVWVVCSVFVAPVGIINTAEARQYKSNHLQLKEILVTTPVNKSLAKSHLVC